MILKANHNPYKLHQYKQDSSLLAGIMEDAEINPYHYAIISELVSAILTNQQRCVPGRSPTSITISAVSNALPGKKVTTLDLEASS